MLAKKLRITGNQKILIMNAPAGIIETLNPLPENCTVSTETGGAREVFDLVLLFTLNKSELGLYGDDAITSLKKDGILWFAYPKKTSGIKTDLTRDEGWAFLDTYSLSGVSNIAIDDIWSGIRFKQDKEGIGHEQRMADYKANLKKDVNRVVEVPDDFQKALNENPQALQVFEKFAYTHRKEYVSWIESAKKQETRDSRILKAIERISGGVKFS